MYYVEESHPAIIEKDIWEAVQLEIERGKDYMERHGVKQLDFVKVHENPFTGRVICGECGSAFGRKARLDAEISMWMRKSYLKHL